MRQHDHEVSAVGKRQAFGLRSSTFCRAAAALLCTLLAISCSADRIVAFGQGEVSRVEVSVGDQIEITLRAAALGAYASPPAISSSAVVFLDVMTPTEDPVPPGGPAQRFRFRAVSTGTSMITFTPVQIGPAAVDTIVVR